MSEAPYFLYYAIAAVFVGSSLIAMRIPMGKALKMALGWVAIFALAFLVFAFRGEFSALGQRIRGGSDRKLNRRRRNGPHTRRRGRTFLCEREGERP